jgi:hypothetical protein
MFLVLRRHLRIMKLATCEILDRDELAAASQTIDQILDVVAERIRFLEGEVKE